MARNRTENVKKNIMWSNVSNVVLTMASFINRTIFIYILGVNYLGVSGLFANVLGILSFAELGIGSAINFSLYKPIADDDTEKIKSIMQLYKKAYRVIAGIVAGSGIILMPFLEYLVKTDIPMSEIQLFYLIFLFNTVSSYFVSYKTSYVSALQKNYIITNINTLGQIVTYILQIVILLSVPSYLVYLLVGAVIGLLQKIITVVYLNSKYSILAEEDAQPLDKKTKTTIWNNMKALIVHKIGDVSVHQTDNIIISLFVNTTTVGLISNYTTLTLFVSKFTNSIFNSCTASLGNLIVKETKRRQREIFDIYDFIGFWIYGYVFIAFTTLVQPFITLWLGKELLIDTYTMVLFFAAAYLEGMTITTYNFKIAAGKFNEDKWLAFVQAIVNLLVSIIAVKMIGLPGVYIGTIAQRIIVLLVRPYIVYTYVLDESVLKYYVRFLHRTVLVAAIAVFMWWIRTGIIKSDVTLLNFIFLFMLTVVLPNTFILLLYGRSRIFRELLKKVKR